MTSEEHLKDSERIIDAIHVGMKAIASEHGLEYTLYPEKTLKAKEDLKNVIREYGNIYAIEQLESLRKCPEVYLTYGIEDKIAELKSQLPQ